MDGEPTLSVNRPEQDDPSDSELASLGLDVHWLGFLRWLAEHGRHPEWSPVVTVIDLPEEQRSGDPLPLA